MTNLIKARLLALYVLYASVTTQTANDDGFVIQHFGGDVLPMLT